MQDSRIADFFAEEHIEYYAALAYQDCRETAPGIMARESFTPRSVLLFLLPYYAGETDNLSRYAAARDYHIAIREVGERLIDRLRACYPDAAFHTYGDHSPIDECHAARIAGLGVGGDNGLLINERYGSYVFIADVVTDLDPQTLGAVSPCEPGTCEHCGACRAACPTGVLRGESFHGRMVCLSAITQRKGELEPHEIALMRQCHTVWGCDACQSCCPHNRQPVASPLAFFHESRTPRLTYAQIAAMPDGEFAERAYAWRKRRTLLRNLAAYEAGDEGASEMKSR